MLTLLTPSKTMDFTSALPIAVRPTQPLFYDEAQTLRVAVQQLTASDIQTLMKVSQPLALATQQLYANEPLAKPALWAYVGDVYKGFQAQTLSVDAAEWAQSHLLIPSGLYGLLRPFDAIAGYRLEMKAPLRVNGQRNLYDFWSDKLGRYIETHAAGQLLILSSQEYAKTIEPYLSAQTQVVTPAFIDRKPNGQEQQVAIYNKMMRGVMARWIVDERITSLDDTLGFAAHGYRFSPERSMGNAPVFYRPQMTPLQL